MSKEGTLPRVSDLVPSVLKAIASQDGMATNEQISAFVAHDLSLSADIASIAHNKTTLRGRTELEYRIAWARTRLRQQGKIESPSRKVWRLVRA